MNAKSGRKTASNEPEQRPLLEVRSLVIITASVMVATVFATLTWFAGYNLWACALAAATSFGVSLERLHRWTA